MTIHTLPGTSEFRALIQPFINKGTYPKEREIGEDEADNKPVPIQRLLVEFFTLVEVENKIAQFGKRPEKGGAWAKKRQKICEKLRELLAADIGLIEIDMVQQHAIDKGAIPDLRKENGGGKYYRTPDHFMAHWACGTNVMSKEIRGEQTPWCPTCDKEPKSQQTKGPTYHTEGFWVNR
jgi:hypothetical protein